MNDGGNKPASLAVLWLAAGMLLAVSINNMLMNGVYSWMLKEPAFWDMMRETAVLSAVIGAGMALGKSVKVKLLPVVLASAVFCWIHVNFLPVLLNLIYFVYIGLAGSFVNRLVFGERGAGIFGDFVTGTGTVVTMFCLLSLTGFGSISVMQAAVLVTGAPLLFWFLRKRRRRAAAFFREVEKWEPDLSESLTLTFIIVMVLIQAGKMNLAVDYDSLWYGLRSPFVLNNGKGIYENLGLLGMVYVYSKGWETLLLPLSPLPSYSFVTAGSLWAGVLLLFAVYRLAACFLNKKEALFVTALVSSVPGIMNMMISAKTDVPTLLFQTLLLYFMAEYARGRGLRELVFSCSAFLISWTLKPTAMVFSTAVFGMGCLFFLTRRILPCRGRSRQWAALLPAFFMLAGIWGRTLLLTGVPVTSVFSGFFQRLGFQVKYPYRGTEIPNSGDGMTLVQTAVHMGKRLYGLFVSPTSQEMGHVIFAWGSALVAMSFVIMVWARRARKRERRMSGVQSAGKNGWTPGVRAAGKNGWTPGMRAARKGQSRRKRGGQKPTALFWTIYLPFLAVNLAGLFMLGQVDGNYFGLLYILTILGAAIAVSSLRTGRLRLGVKRLAVPILAANLVLCALSNWAWSLGFTPIQVMNKGYYDHREMERQKKEDGGNRKIWEILASDPTNRVLAVGEHPQVLSFPCCVQSFNDITGDWGNSEAVLPKYGSTLQFIEYAKIDYIYIQGDYRPSNERPFWMARYLIRNGKVSDIIQSNGNLLLRIDQDGRPDSGRDSVLMADLEKSIVPEFSRLTDPYVRAAGELEQ